MTESEWLSSKNPHVMMSWLVAASKPFGYYAISPPPASDRKFNLFCAACCWEYASDVGQDAAHGGAQGGWHRFADAESGENPMSTRPSQICDGGLMLRIGTQRSSHQRDEALGMVVDVGDVATQCVAELVH